MNSRTESTLKPLKEKFQEIGRKVSGASGAAKRKWEMERQLVYEQASTFARLDQQNQVKLAELNMTETAQHNELGLKLQSIAHSVCSNSHRANLVHIQSLANIRKEYNGENGDESAEAESLLPVDTSELMSKLNEVIAMQSSDAHVGGPAPAKKRRISQVRAGGAVNDELIRSVKVLKPGTPLHLTVKKSDDAMAKKSDRVFSSFDEATGIVSFVKTVRQVEKIHISKLDGFESAETIPCEASDFADVLELIDTTGSEKYRWGGDSPRKHDGVSFWTLLTKYYGYYEWIKRPEEEGGAATRPIVWESLVDFHARLTASESFKQALGNNVSEKLRYLDRQIAAHKDSMLADDMVEAGYSKSTPDGSVIVGDSDAGEGTSTTVASAIESRQLLDKVPEKLVELVEALPDKVWKNGTASYRKSVKCLQFGLTRFQNQETLGSRRYPELEQAIIAQSLELFPELKLTSIIINKYGPDIAMGEHSDQNLPDYSRQMTFIWGEYTGGELTVGDKVCGNGVWLMDGNCKHHVSSVLTGTRYSIVTYAKHLNEKTAGERIDQLKAAGYPLPEFGSPPISSGSGSQPVPHFVISLDTEEGSRRRAGLNFHHTIMPGYTADAVPEWLDVKLQGRYTTNRGAVLGCLYAHFRVWEQAGADAVVVLEDDARKIPGRECDLLDLPTDGITMLGGVIRSPTTWDNEKAWLESGQFLQHFVKLTPGINRVQTKMTGTLSYYLPPGYAAKLVQKLQAGHGKAVDIWLIETQLVKYFWFPNVYMDATDAVSQTGSPSASLVSDFYMSCGMRDVAAKMGFHAPARGADIKEWDSVAQSYVSK